MSQQVSGKVLIIGAGLGGLMLAQFLRKDGVSCEIFERDDHVDSRKGGWGISLIEALPILAQLLPEDVSEVERASVNYHNGSLDTMLTYDIMHDRDIFRLGGIKKGQDGYYIRADRQALRRHLWQHLNVHAGKYFERYEISASGDEVTAFFKDGTSHTGNVLIGADGANSRVRRQLLSDRGGDATLSRYIPIWADLSLTPNQVAEYRDLSNALVIGAAPNVFFALGQKQIDPTSSSSAQYYWNLCFRSQDPEKHASDIAAASQDQLYKRSRALTQAWPDFMRKLVHEYTRPENMATHPPQFYEFVPPETLPEGPVTLMGDALHPMVPFRGAGANTAAKDASDLFHLIKEKLVAQHGQAARNTSSWSAILQEYARTAVPRGIEMVLSSRAAGEQNQGNTGDNPMSELAKGRWAARSDEQIKR